MNITDTQKTRWMLGRKIAAGYLIVLVLMCAIAGVAINRFQAFEANLHSILDVEWRKTEAANTVSEVVANNSRMTMQQLLVVPTERAALRQAITDQRGKMIAAYQFLQESVDSEEGRGLLRDFEPLRRKFVQSQKRFEELLDQDLITEAQAELATNALPTVMQVQALTSQLTQAAANNAGIHGAEMLQAADRATWMIAGLAGLALAFGVWVAWRLTRAITQPLSQAVQVAQAVAAGDLSRSITITHYDETGQLLQALRTMNTGLAQIVGSVRQASTSIAAATSEIATGNTDLSSRTEEQASALEETSAAMQQVLATVMQNAGNSQQAFDLARRTATLAGEGGAVVTQAVQTMQSVSASSQQIADIVGLIEGIAFQTNILALNAAVEAARAGEQGRGFAVVASEVRALAGRSAQASKDIKQLIQTSVAGIGDGCALVEQAGTTMSHIVRSVQDVAQLLGEISSASQEQTAGLEQVKNAVLQMDHMTQQNAALVEEAAAAAHALEAQAQGLTRTVGRFQLSVGATDVGSATVTNRGVPKTPSRSAQRAAALSMS